MTWTTQPRFKTKNGLSGYRTGTGPTLVLLHGVGLRSESWNAISQSLNDVFSIYAIDLPGHGESADLDRASTLKDYTLKDYSGVIADYLKTFEQPVYLAGHSMGAMIALDIAMRAPSSVKSIAALNAVYQRSDEASTAVKMRAEALRTVQQNNLNTDMTLARWFGNKPMGDALKAAQACNTWLHETPVSQYKQAYHVFAHHHGLSSAQLADLIMPALFLTGANELNSTPDMSRAMAKAAPLGTAKIISGAAHMMPMTHANQVATILKHHFKG